MNFKNYLFKVVLLGEEAVGKTAIIRTYLSSRFNPNSGSVYWKDLEIDGRLVRLSIWDNDSFYESSGALGIFDLTNTETCRKLTSRVLEARKDYKDIPIVIVGNKLDLANLREVSKEEAIEFLKGINYSAYIETSAKTGENIDDLFKTLVRFLIRWRENNLNSTLYQELEPEAQAFLKYFYYDQVKSGDYESIPFSYPSYLRFYSSEFISYSKTAKNMTSEYFLKMRDKKSKPDTNRFYDLQKTMNRFKQLKVQFKKPLLMKVKESKYIALKNFDEVLQIFTKISNDEYFSISSLKIRDNWRGNWSFLGIGTYTGYSILFDQVNIVPDNNYLVVRRDEVFVSYIDEKFKYLNEWQNHQLYNYCVKNGLNAPVRKIEKIKTIQDSNPTDKPSLDFLDRLIKRPEIFKEIVSHFLDSKEIEKFVQHCTKSFPFQGEVLNEISDRETSSEDTIEIFFSLIQDYWGKINDFTIFYYNFPMKELEIQNYVKKKYPNLYSVKKQRDLFGNIIQEDKKLKGKKRKKI